MTITTDPVAWYRAHGADAGVDLPAYLLTSLRDLPRIRATNSGVRLARLSRRGRGAARQLPQHRSPDPRPFLGEVSVINRRRARRHRLDAEKHSSLTGLIPGIVNPLLGLLRGGDQQIPQNPSGKYLQSV
ncbi:hypothetical protein [Saccharopolyspora elongata]|uniref:Uncharacterized protein n=1 Tax=Saccharopolyspora elongata TaxID=2530387 RepID=A0A4R4Y7K2_9PSEU|nr:hypothetical protein [Saccharopolyspora elongata]TDD39609.1 hypothetical protein E1288_36635 [Saccharopolyspora elongata]